MQAADLVAALPLFEADIVCKSRAPLGEAQPAAFASSLRSVAVEGIAVVEYLSDQVVLHGIRMMNSLETGIRTMLSRANDGADSFRKSSPVPSPKLGRLSSSPHFIRPQVSTMLDHFMLTGDVRAAHWLQST